MKIENPSSYQDSINYPYQQSSNKSSMPLIAGILLIVAGVFSLISFITSYLVLDLTTIESMGFVTQFQQIYPDMTAEQILGFVRTCTIVFLIIAIFPILGGILALKKKMWGIALACSIIGLFSIGILFTSSVISLIAMILLIISRNEFQ
ncbi:MAG: hypothetical protein KAW45_04280 [Thermoplasmatales archaeon]|nr:hypothetical protein [Thermoplasmatales archaeon]